MLGCIIVCHAIVRVRTAVIAFPMFVASSGERAPGLVSMAETAEDSSMMLFCARHKGAEEIFTSS